MLLFWLRATRENLWRWWLGFGACQFLVLWVYPAAIYILVILNGLVAHQGVDRKTRRREISPLASGEFDGGDGGYASHVAISSAVAQLLENCSRGATTSDSKLAH
jgi:hypothetical protein